LKVYVLLTKHGIMRGSPPPLGVDGS
jgi:hypothetical protein